MDKKIFKSLDSTNNKAQELISKREILDTCWVQASNQYKGKGMGENTWFSEPERNITGSLVIFPHFVMAEDQFNISVAASLAVYDLLDLYFEDIRIKWPNDILLDGSKVCGLLVEHAVRGKKIDYSIIGIGLNVNQRSFPPDIPNPTSFLQKLNIEFVLEELRDLLLGFMERRFNQLEKGHYGSMKVEYLQKLFRFKDYAPYRSNGQWFRARITDVDSFGQIILETESGDIRIFGFKDVEFID